MTIYFAIVVSIIPKCNTNIVVPQQVDNLMFDIHDASKVWIATLGTGFYKGTIKNGDKVQVVKTSPGVVNYRSEKETKLKPIVEVQDYTLTFNRATQKLSSPYVELYATSSGKKNNKKPLFKGLMYLQINKL